MFEVRLSYAMGDDWQERDAAIEAAAGRESEWAGAGCEDGNCGRDHGWNAKTFGEARALKASLDALPDVNVTIRER